MRSFMSTTDVLPVSSVPARKETIRDFFDSIARRYDFINQILSWNLDELWRRKSRDIIFDKTDQSILDLGVGTGKFIRLFLKKKTWGRAVGLDFSGKMLETARELFPSKVNWTQADFHDLPFTDQTFDVVISSYTLRSVQDLPKFFGELFRILTPKGKVGLLCLTRPVNPVWRALSYPYLKFFLPTVGGWLSGNPEAYRFLSSTILSFQTPEETAKMLQSQGFPRVEIHRFSFGLATLIAAHKG